ncbi:MAG: FtsW/RodA/SpoVE family cell cycle protein [Akkermansiaceae bacterium]
MTRLATYLILISVGCLVAMGLVMLASTSYWANGLEQPHLLVGKQSKILGFSLAVGFIIHQLKPELLRKMALWIFLSGAVMLALCYLPKIGVEVNGAKRWVKFPGLPQFQPSEIGKITTILGIAAYYARYVSELRTFWKGFVLPGMILSVPILLILFEKDMDTALALAVACLAALFCIGVKLRYLGPVFLLAAFLGYTMVMQDETRRQRIDAWLHLEENPKEYQDTNRQQWRSLLAFGNGGPEGMGLGNGIEKHGYLPEAHTDFIYPVIGEELGLYYSLAVLLCYVALAIGGFLVALNTSDIFGRCVALGLTMILLIPAMINIGVTIGTLPNAGLPLPFVSYGGTNLMFSLWSVALLLCINRSTQLHAIDDSQAAIPKPIAMRL